MDGLSSLPGYGRRPSSNTKQLTRKRIGVDENRAEGSTQPLPGVVRPR